MWKKWLAKNPSGLESPESQESLEASAETVSSSRVPSRLIIWQNEFQSNILDRMVDLPPTLIRISCSWHLNEKSCFEGFIDELSQELRERLATEKEVD